MIALIFFFGFAFGFWLRAKWKPSPSLEEWARLEYLESLSETPQSKGGKARAAKLTPQQRQDISRKAANARWNKTTAPTQ